MTPSRWGTGVGAGAKLTVLALTVVLMTAPAHLEAQAPEATPNPRCLVDTLDDNAERLPGALRLTTAGPGRRGTLQVLGGEQWTNQPERFFPLEDYVRWARDTVEDLHLKPGLYAARILPPGRNRRLFPGARDIDTGKDGAILLTRAVENNLLPSSELPFCTEDAYIIHSGEMTTTNAEWLRSIHVEPEDLRTIMGTLAGIRVDQPAYRTWRDVPLARMTDSVRFRVFQPYPVEVVTRERTFWEFLFRRSFGSTVEQPRTVPSTRGAPPLLLSPEEVHLAQLTAGLDSAGYMERVRALEQRYGPAMTELERIAAIENDAERRRRLAALSPQTQETLALFAAVSQGIRDDIENGVLQSPIWPEQVLARLERTTDRLESYADAGAEDTSGTAGGIAWIHGATPRGEKCDLAAVHRPIAQLDIPVIAGRMLRTHGSAMFWFQEIPGQVPTYLMHSSIRLNANGIRPLHRAIANQEMRANRESCSSRWSLRETDEWVTPAGELRTKANVRNDQHACVTVKYPCGISIRGTKSCKKVMSTKLGSITVGVRKLVRTRANPEGVEVEAGGQPQVVRFTSIVPGFQNLQTMTGLQGSAARFAKQGSEIWHVVELRGDQPMRASVACSIVRLLQQDTISARSE